MEPLKTRLTDRRVAEALRDNAEGLMAKGIEPAIDDLRYIKLAEYENEQERKDKVLGAFATEDYYE